MKTLKLFLVVLLATIFSTNLFAQQKIHLAELYSAMEKNNPLSGIPTLLDSVSGIERQNLGVNYLPKINLNAQSTWQSDVIEFSIPFPGITIPTPDPDQHKITLDATQLLWDGGATSAMKKVNLAQTQAEKSNVKNEIYKLREKLNEAFFAVILLDITSNQLDLMKNELNANMASVQSGVKQGVILESNLLTIQAEILRLEQKMLEIPAKKESLVTVIESITGMKLGYNPEFVLPGVETSEVVGLARPELESFELQKKLFDSRATLLSAKRRPTLGTFVSVGYGKPGLNMISNDWDTYVIAGAKLSWNIWDWNSTKRQKQQLDIQKSIIDQRKKSFSNIVNAQQESSLHQIETINMQLEKDREIVELLESVKLKSASKLNNGTISSTEYLSDFNSAARAKLDMEYRKILLEKEKVNLNFIVGNNIDN